MIDPIRALQKGLGRDEPAQWRLSISYARTPTKHPRE